MAKPRRDEGDGYVLLVHQRGTRMPRVVEANLRYVEIAEGRLPHRAEGRRVVGLTRLVADDIAPVDVGLTKRELLNGLSVLRRREFTQQRIRYGKDATRIRRLGARPGRVRGHLRRLAWRQF